MKQFDITVTIRVSVSDADSQAQYDEAMIIANAYADMSTRYKSISADKILEVSAKETQNV